jgi:hypothetical protein
MSRHVAYVPDVFALCVYDPGRATGIAQGVFRSLATERATLRRAVAKRAVRMSVLNAPVTEQGHYLARIWRDFRFRMVVEYGVPESCVWLAVEDFNLRQMAVDLAPVEVFASLRTAQRVPLTDGWHDDVREGGLLRWSASQAKTHATDARMRDWGLWSLACEADRRGGTRLLGDHARDATRHLALGVSLGLQGKLVA